MNTTTFTVRKEIIMLVEPEPRERRVIQRNLEGMGFPVIATEDGTEAQEILRFLDDSDIKLLITDQNLPAREGEQLARNLYRKNTNAKMVLISNQPVSQLPDQFHHMGISAYLQKPVEREVLGRLVNRLLSL